MNERMEFFVLRQQEFIEGHAPHIERVELPNRIEEIVVPILVFGFDFGI